VLIGKDYAKCLGCSTSQEACVKLSKETKEGALIVCAWGADGASGRDASGEVRMHMCVCTKYAFTCCGLCACELWYSVILVITIAGGLYKYYRGTSSQKFTVCY
jgi:hypothetical protein